MKLLAILRFIRHSTVLLGVGLVGGAVAAAGVVMLVTPGPGLVVIIAGLAILSTQFTWAERALGKMKQRAIAARDKASARRADRRATPPGAAGPAAGATTDSQVDDFHATQLRRDVTDGEVADGYVTDGGVTDGGVTDGDVTDGGVTDGGVTHIRLADNQVNDIEASETRAPSRSDEAWGVRDSQATG